MFLFMKMDGHAYISMKFLAYNKRNDMVSSMVLYELITLSPLNATKHIYVYTDL